MLGAVAIAAACDALGDWGPLVAEEERLLRRLRDGLAALPGVCELSLWGREHPRVGIVAFTVDGRDALGGRPKRCRGTTASASGRPVLRAHLLVGRLLGLQEAACRGPATVPAAPSAIRVSIGVGTTDEHARTGCWPPSRRCPPPAARWRCPSSTLLGRSEGGSEAVEVDWLGAERAYCWWRGQVLLHDDGRLRRVWSATPSMSALWPGWPRRGRRAAPADGRP